MRLRGLFRVLVASLLTYSIFILGPRYISEQCSKPELQATGPCTAFFTVKSEIGLHSRNVWNSISSHPYASKIADKYHSSGVDAHLCRGYTTVSHRWDADIKPRIDDVSARAGRSLVSISKRVYEELSEFASQKALPFLLEKSALLRQRLHLWLVELWLKIESSGMWKDVIVAQARNIYDTVLKRASQLGETVVEEKEAVKNAASAEIASASLSSSVSAAESAASSASATAAASSSSASAASSSAAAAASSSSAAAAASAAAASSSSAASASESSSSSSAAASAAASSSTGAENPSWLQRVEKNVDFAIANLEEDAQDFLKRTVDDAKPDIMQQLRGIAAYGEESVRKLTALAEQIEAHSPGFDTTLKTEAYELYDTDLKALADMAFKVRDRADSLAHEALEGLDPVRLVTLDALDDYFDVVLTEAAREMTAKDDWNGWKDYHQLKQTLKDLRGSVEGYEFNMETVNTALRESQSASIILVQQYNQKLTDLRAQCQMTIQLEQERRAAEKAAAEQAEAGEEPEPESPAEPKSESVNDAESRADAEAEAEAGSQKVDTDDKEEATDFEFVEKDEVDDVKPKKILIDKVSESEIISDDGEYVAIDEDTVVIDLPFED